ncbi:MAG: leucine-rich repeat protein [Erysipelotrichales bacterium]|nr:leucine-rich repeat protein [Erysipelotrichales bacterium]
MKSKRLLLALLGVMLVSCGRHTNSTSTSVGQDSSSTNPSVSTTTPKELVYDANLPEVKDDGYEFAKKSYADFPTNLVETSGLTYELSEDETYYKVSGKTSFYGDVLVIPSFHNGLPVKEIVNDAFAEKVRLKEVYIPETIEKLGAGVFNCTPLLEKVYYNAKNVADLQGKNWAFLPVDKATNKIDVYFGPSVEKIPNRLFYPLSTDPDRIPYIKNIYFSENSKLKTIGEYAFYKSSNAIIHDLPDTIESIGNYAFYEGKTENLDLPVSLKNIGQFAFAFNEDLKRVNFHEDLEVVGEHAFYNCRKLTKVDLSKTKIEVLGSSSFRNCESLNKVLFPSTLNKIDKRAFENAGLEVVDLPNNLEIVGENAFIGCHSLVAIKLNSSLKTIYNGAFEDAINVTKLVVNSIELEDFGPSNKIFSRLGQNTNGVEVIFMETVKRIPQRMFFPNANEDLDPNIKRVVLLKTIEEIGDYAFYELSVGKIDYEGNEEQLQNINMGNNILTNVECYNN